MTISDQDQNLMLKYFGALLDKVVAGEIDPDTAAGDVGQMLTVLVNGEDISDLVNLPKAE